jgi:hypothetical protein
MQELLEGEGLTIENDKILNFSEHKYHFDDEK